MKALTEQDQTGIGSDLSHTTPFRSAEVPFGLNEALAKCLAAGIEVVSAVPEWIEMRMPADLSALPPLERLLAQLAIDLPEKVGEAIRYGCREMLTNAVEYGCRLDPAKRVEVRFLRLKRAVICRIRDPGDGFEPAELKHAAINNPADEPLKHVFVREKNGFRPGGFGILLTSQLVDELVYNERHNELVLVKYLF